MKRLIMLGLAAVAFLFGFASCSGDLHDIEVSTVVIEIPISTGYNASTLTITNVPVSGDTAAIDGSLFSWCGGAKGEAKKNSATGALEVTATSNEVQAWVEAESAFKGDFPEGADTSCKLALAGEEKFFCFKNGGSYTMDWADRR